MGALQPLQERVMLRLSMVLVAVVSVCRLQLCAVALRPLHVYRPWRRLLLWYTRN